MNKHLKIMIAYDGSDHSETAIDDLQLAGLPREGSALIVSVQNSISSSALSNIDLVEKAVTSRRILSTAALWQERTSETFNELKTAVAKAAEDVRSYLPEWEIESKTLLGKPAQILLNEASFRQPDLVIVGSHKRSAVGRFFLGSVSTELANKLECTVRVVGGTELENINIYPRIIAAIDDSPEIELIVRHIGNRVWDEQTEVRLVMVEDKFNQQEDPEVLSKQQLRLEWAIEQLEAIGLKVSIEFIKGDPKTAFLEAANRWKANSVFVSATRFDDSPRNGLDEAAANLVNGANCSVEIVR